MGHSSKNRRTQGTNEGSAAPLPPNPTFTVWAPVLRKVVAVALGGFGLAGIGALSMAQPHVQSDGAVSPATAALANLAPGAEWLAGAATSDVKAVETQPAPSATAPPCAPLERAGGPAPPGSEAATGTAGAATGILSDGRVVLNVASATELTTLPGIGQKRAEAIVALRSRLTRFRKLSDLLRVKGIGVKSLRKLEPKLVLDVPSQTQ